MQVGAFFTSIPQCVLGGMTTFLFAGVCVSGIKVTLLHDVCHQSLRSKATSLSVGLEPQIA